MKLIDSAPPQTKKFWQTLPTHYANQVKQQLVADYSNRNEIKKLAELIFKNVPDNMPFLLSVDQSNLVSTCQFNTVQKLQEYFDNLPANMSEDLLTQVERFLREKLPKEKGIMIDLILHKIRNSLQHVIQTEFKPSFESKFYQEFYNVLLNKTKEGLQRLQ